jgi:hypothetical protein
MCIDPTRLSPQNRLPAECRGDSGPGFARFWTQLSPATGFVSYLDTADYLPTIIIIIFALNCSFEGAQLGDGHMLIDSFDTSKSEQSKRHLAAYSPSRLVYRCKVPHVNRNHNLTPLSLDLFLASVYALYFIASSTHHGEPLSGEPQSLSAR